MGKHSVHTLTWDARPSLDVEKHGVGASDTLRLSYIHILPDCNDGYFDPVSFSCPPVVVMHHFEPGVV